MQPKAGLSLWRCRRCGRGIWSLEAPTCHGELAARAGGVPAHRPRPRCCLGRRRGM